MKYLVVMLVLLTSCVACGYIGSGLISEGARTEVMTCYDKEIERGDWSVGYIVVFVDSDGNAYQDDREEDPAIYTKVEIGRTYQLEITGEHNHDIVISKIVECQD